MLESPPQFTNYFIYISPILTKTVHYSLEEQNFFEEEEEENYSKTGSSHPSLIKGNCKFTSAAHN